MIFDPAVYFVAKYTRVFKATEMWAHQAPAGTDISLCLGTVHRRAPSLQMMGKRLEDMGPCSEIVKPDWASPIGWDVFCPDGPKSVPPVYHKFFRVGRHEKGAYAPYFYA